MTVKNRVIEIDGATSTPILFGSVYAPTDVTAVGTLNVPEAGAPVVGGGLVYEAGAQAGSIDIIGENG